MRLVEARLAVGLGVHCLSSSALGQVIPVGPFTGSHREGFENFPVNFFVPELQCFAGNAMARQVGGSLGIIVVGGWGGATGSMNPHSGTWFLGGWTGVTVEWEFAQPAQRFGGYFGTIKPNAGATARFYDDSGTLLAEMPVTCPSGAQWHWDGWKSTGKGFSRVRITGAGPDAGRVMHDDLQLDFDGCYADCDGTGALTISDFSCYQARFAAGDSRADCNASGTLTIADFGCFQAAFVQGCP